MKTEEIARVCHEVNRAYCQALGDNSQLPWESAPEWQRNSAMMGVELHLSNPDAGPQASHESWMAQKTAEGWVYGPMKDPETKQHPCMVPFAELPVDQQAKDFIFRGVVLALEHHQAQSDTDDLRKRADELNDRQARILDRVPVLETLDDDTRRPIMEYAMELERLRSGAPMSNGAVDVLFERRRQSVKEGLDHEHDDEHDHGDLAHAGAAYAIEAAGGNGERLWPFVNYWKPKDPRRNLVRAAALIIAEIDRMDRAALGGE